MTPFVFKVRPDSLAAFKRRVNEFNLSVTQIHEFRDFCFVILNTTKEVTAEMIGRLPEVVLMTTTVEDNGAKWYKPAQS